MSNFRCINVTHSQVFKKQAEAIFQLRGKLSDEEKQQMIDSLSDALKSYPTVVDNSINVQHKEVTIGNIKRLGGIAEITKKNLQMVIIGWYHGPLDCCTLHLENLFVDPV